MGTGQKFREQLRRATPGDKGMPRWAQRLEQENERLKAENATLREETKETRSLHKRMLDALENPPVVEVTKRRGAFLRTILIGGGALVLGMRLGRERYEQMLRAAKERATAAKQRMGRSGDEGFINVPEATPSEQTPEASPTL